LATRDRSKIQSAISAAVANVRKACGNGSFKASVDWRSFLRKRMHHLAHAAVSYLEPLAALCADRDYRQRIRQLQRARFMISSTNNKHGIKLGATQISIRLATEQPNNALAAATWLRENL
jgi:predicted ATPase